MPSLRLLPHGGYTLIPAVLSTCAWLASLSQDGCDYARLSGYLVATITKSADIPYLEVGFTAYREPIQVEDGDWKIQYTGTCLAFTDDFILDGYWMAAKAFAFIALVLGGGGALFLWFSSCFVFSRGTWRFAGYEVLLASIAQCLSFIWYATAICNGTGDVSCVPSYGSKANIAATACWMASALAIFCKYPLPKQLLVNDEEENNPPTVEIIDDDDHSSQQGGEETSERDVEDVPIEGDAKASLYVADSKKDKNGTVVQTTPAEADLL